MACNENENRPFENQIPGNNAIKVKLENCHRIYQVNPSFHTLVQYLSGPEHLVVRRDPPFG
jgi:hypothetical protein